MNWHSEPCRKRRQDLALLAAHALPDSESAALESHLASCPTCREYLKELQTLAATMATRPPGFAGLEPSKAAQARWTAAIHQSAKSDHASAPNTFLQDFWRELVLPCRRYVAGAATVWLLLWIANSAMLIPFAGATIAAARQTPGFWQDYAAQRQYLAELMGSKILPIAEPPRLNLPRPRGELPYTVRFC